MPQAFYGVSTGDAADKEKRVAFMLLEHPSEQFFYLVAACAHNHSPNLGHMFGHSLSYHLQNIILSSPI